MTQMKVTVALVKRGAPPKALEASMAGSPSREDRSGGDLFLPGGIGV